MFVVREILPVVILLAILAPASFAKNINYGGPKGASSGHYEEGSGNNRYASHENKQGDRADKGYKSYHDAEEFNRGHHDADENKGYYNEDGGVKKNHHHDDGYYDEHHEGEEGEKGESFLDKGHYGKGYSTQGHHEVKRLDEFEKHKEFYDEDHDSGFDEADGGHQYGREYEKGGSYKGGHNDYDEHQADYGKRGHYEKGQNRNEHKGYSGDDSSEHYYRNDYRHGKDAGLDDGRKWGYKKGH